MSDQNIYAASWLLNPNAPPLAGGALLVGNGIIQECGTLEALRSAYGAPVIEFPGSVLIPGFINTHTHLELTHFPSWRIRSSVDYNPRRFTDWIIQLIKIMRGLTPEEFPPSVREGIRMCLESGTTAVGEIVTNPLMAGEYYRSPLAGRLYFELLGQDTRFFTGKLAAALAAATSAETPEKLLSGLSAHSPYTIAHEFLAGIGQTATSHSLPLAIHLSESRAEGDFIFDGSGELASEFYPFVGWERYLGHPARCSSTELLDRNGLLTPTTLAIHCVHVGMADAHILKSRGVHVALCPRSNDLLDVGRAPVHLFKKLGIPLTLGTDSLASNNSLSLWDELRFALETFPDDLSADDLFNMVTDGGAKALGISAECGTLERGKRADFQVVGSCSGSSGTVLERVMREGAVQEVYVSGVRYTGNV